VTDQSIFPVEPWAIRETRLDLGSLAQSESILALSNGHIGLRANLDEGEPSGLPGTYLNSCYELRPLPYAEAGYGYPESGQTVVNVTNGKVIRLLVDDENFDVRYGTLHSHERVLDMRAGTLERTAEWSSPAGKRVRVRSTRLVSFTQRAVAAISYEVEPLDEEVRIIVMSGLITNEDLPVHSKDPRAAAALDKPLLPELHLHRDTSAVLVHRTRASQLRVGAAMDHELEAPVPLQVDSYATPDWARTTVTCRLAPGQKLRVVKLLSYGWSSQRSLDSVRDQVVGALAGARQTTFEGLLAEQRQYLDEFWDAADVEIDGDAEIQQAARFGLFHVLQSGARAERRALPAKGLTGPGYDGHTFWDTEMFVLPVLTYTVPDAARDALYWRRATIDLAQQRAHDLGLNGAAFPWRTIRGHECSAYWPAGTAAFHITADIADATVRYMNATGDETFERECGVELLVESARMWRSLGAHDRHGAFHIDGVTGPDEYSAIVDDNIYTNLMAQRNLREAAAACGRHPDVARALEVDEEESASWRDAAESMFVPYDADIGIHPQSQGFTRHAEWDFQESDGKYPLLLNYPYVQLYRKQVVKQADLVLAMHWRGDMFDPEAKARNFAYYEERTCRDSSLSPCTQSIMAAETGHLGLALDYLGIAALMDLRDLEHNTRDGVHMASLAGTWLALVAGLGGMRDHDGVLSFDPALPDGLDRMAFRLRWRGCRLHVEVTHSEVIYTVRDSDSAGVDLVSAGEHLKIAYGKPVKRPVSRRTPLGPLPRHPFGMEPPHRGR
jgi:alpha,alpha-trehalose phosphorylase